MCAYLPSQLLHTLDCYEEFLLSDLAILLVARIRQHVCVFSCDLWKLWAVLGNSYVRTSSPAGDWDQTWSTCVSPQALCTLGCSREILTSAPTGHAGGQDQTLCMHISS